MPRGRGAGADLLSRWRRFHEKEGALDISHRITSISAIEASEEQVRMLSGDSFAGFGRAVIIIDFASAIQLREATPAPPATDMRA